MSWPIAVHQLFALFRPSRLRAEARRIYGKWSRRLGKVDARVVTLAPAGPARGDVLVSYIIDPFLLPPSVPLPRSHTHFWESRQIARTFVDLGFRVDAVSWQNDAFSPTKPYRAVVDVRLNLERWAAVLPPDCVKIMHIETAHRSFHNPAQEARLDALAARRGVRLRPQKMLEENRAIESADCATVLGNEMTMETYSFAGKPLYRVPISVPVVYEEIERDIAACRRRFLWFGSGGLVHKGLDRVLEAFAAMPDYHLTVCGPVHRERDFERLYYRELYQTPNIETLGWIDVASPAFRTLAARTLGLIYPSCSEGGGGSVITCMHAGLIPVVTYEASVSIAPHYGVLLADAEIDTLEAAVQELAARPAAELAAMGSAARHYARQHYTRERFAAVHRQAIEAILERFPSPS